MHIYPLYNLTAILTLTLNHDRNPEVGLPPTDHGKAGLLPVTDGNMTTFPWLVT